MLLRNSLKQIGRTKTKTIVFLLLTIFAVTFLSLGVNLWQACNANMKEYEKAFMTIGVVNQKENAMEVNEHWDASIKEYTYWDKPVYDSILPITLLDFEGANYITKPEQRPYYGSYCPDIKIYTSDMAETMTRMWGAFVEIVPYEDCIPNKPVRVKVKRVLWGKRQEGVDIWFCDQFNDNPRLLKAGKTYITGIQSIPIPFTDTYYEPLAYTFPSISTYSTQQSKSGEIPGEKNPSSVERWAEITDNFYNNKGIKWRNYIEIFDKFIKSTIPVVPTSKTELLMGFHKKEVAITVGRDITDEEYKNEDKVCIVPQKLATINNLKIGDKLNLKLYFSDYRKSSSQTYFPSGGVSMGFTLLNARGEAYPVFEDSEYEIVGIYNGSDKTNQPTGYEMGYNAVVIPSNSVKNSDENNIVAYGPMKGYTTSFQIPNGTTRQYMEKFKALGIDNLEISFYDGGYEKLASGMRNLKMVAMILVTVSGATTLAILFFFVFLFVSKQKKRTAIERSLGMNKKECMLSMLYGIIGVISIGGIIGSFAGFILTRFIMLKSMDTGGELYSTAFSNWVNNSDNAIAQGLGSTSVSPLISIILYFVVLLVTLMIALIFINNNLKAEPLALLSKNEE